MKKHIKNKKNINKKGFTLIELLATLAVLSLVASIVLYTAVNIIDDTKEKTYKVTINNIQKQASNYVLESIPYLTWIKSEGIEYQCVTIENLIEKGYFDNDILSSEIKKGTKVQLTDTIYVERDSNKTITKSNLLAGNASEYSSMCLNGSALGQITFNSTPKGWAKQKDITIYFNLFDNIDKTSDYKYEYIFTEEEYNESFDKRSIEKKLTITENGDLLVNIYNAAGKSITNHTITIDKIDNEGPIIKFNYNGAPTVRNSVTIPIEITDNGSGVNYNTFSISDIEVKIGSKVITGGLSLIKNEDNSYDLKIENNYDAGILSITIEKGKILDNIENENENTTLNKNITFDNTYTISYNANDGTGSIDNTVCTYGETCSIKTNSFTKTGYTFQGWTTNSNGTDDSYNWTNWSGTWKYKDNENGIKDGKLTLYAVWKINTYTISYNANGGSGEPSSQTKTHGQNLTLSSTKPTRTGYTFQNWNTKSDGSGTSYSPGGSYTSNSEATLYAIWKINTYTISYNANGGSGAPSSQTKTYGKTLTLSSTTPTRTGYTFQNWNTKSDGSGTSYSPGRSYTNDSEATLYAVWKPNTYTINYNLIYGLENKGNTTTDRMYYSVSNKVVTVTANYDDGYGFINAKVYLEKGKTYIFNATTNGLWSSQTEAFLMLNGEYSKYYHMASKENYEFIPDASGEYWLRLDVNEKGKTYTFSNINITEKSGLSPQTKTHGETLKLSSTKPTRAGYTFKGWSTSNTATSATYTAGGSYTSNSGTTLYAVWKDETKPVITLGTNGTSKWQKSVSSSISVTDAGSGVNASTQKYIFSTSSSATPTSSFTNGGTVTKSDGDGYFYLRIKACDNAGNCTTKTSNKFYIDNTPPTITCHNERASIEQTFNTGETQTLEITAKEECGVYATLAYTKGNVSTSNCYPLTYTYNTTTDPELKKIETIEYINEDGQEVKNFKKSEGNCDNGYCQWRCTMEVTDQAGNSAQKTFTYYIKY